MRVSKWLSVLVVVLGIGIVGCTPAQIQTVARQAGIAAVATWISVDNPSTEQRTVTKGIVTVIQTNAVMVASNASYYTVLMPTVEQYIHTKVAPKDQLICQFAGSWVLTGIDTLMAMNPTWTAKQDVATSVVVAFCDGANMALSMTSSDPVIQAATKAYTARVRVLRSARVRQAVYGDSITNQWNQAYSNQVYSNLSAAAASNQMYSNLSSTAANQYR